MAKELNAQKKDFEKLKKQADGCLESFTKLMTNADHFMNMFQQGAKMVGEAAQEAKGRGITGKTYNDFSKEKEVKSAVSEVEAIHKNYTRDHKQVEDLRKEAGKLCDQLDAQAADIEKEVATRKKKKIVGIDSKSLPDLEKLAKEISGVSQKLKDGLINQPKLDAPDAMWRRTLKNFDYEVGRTKDDRDAELRSEMDRQGLDMRVAKRNFGLVKQGGELIAKACKAAATEQDVKKAKALMVAANKKLKEIAPIVAQYDRALGSIGKRAAESLQTKDGKALVAIHSAMSDILKTSASELKTVGSQLKVD